MTSQESRFLPINCVLAWVVWILAGATLRADYPIMSQHYAADPTAVEHDGRLYVYCSNDEENGEDTGYIMDSIVCFSTDDLKNWTNHGVVFDADDLPWYTGTAWAPAIVKNNDRFYLYFGDAGLGVGVVTSDSPTGPFTDPKGDLVVRRGVTPGADSAWLFDPCVFVDEDDQAYLYFGGESANQARVILLEPNLYDTIGAATPIEFPDFFEALLMHERDGIYYLSYADNYNNDYTDPPPTPSSQIGYMTGPGPLGPFEYQGVALPQPPDNYGNNNHHTFFTFQGEWYAVYHNRYQATQDGVSTTEHRNLCLDRLHYNPDGTLQPVVPTRDGLPQLKNFDPYTRVEAETLNERNGVDNETCSEGGLNLGYIENGDWVRLRGVDFGPGAEQFTARVASDGSGGSIELRLGAVDGPLVGTCAVPPTGGWQDWATVSCPVANATGIHDLYLVFTGDPGYLFNVNWWQFEATGEAVLSTTFEAESGSLGSDWSTPTSDGVTSITIQAASTGDQPDSGDRVATYSVTFPGAGDYELYARVWVDEPDPYTNDSFFYGNGFGPRSPSLADDWITVNGLANASGFSDPGDEVGAGGTATSAVWKWVNLSRHGDPEAGITFSVPEGGLTQDFAIGAREDGLRIDKLVFGRAGVAFTVSELDGYGPENPRPAAATIDATDAFQTIEGIGGAVCFYNGWFPAHPAWEEIADHAFSGLNLSMLRLGNWWRGTDGEDTATYEIVAEAQERLGESLPILMSSWSPPAYLKSNGEVGNGGTLIQVDGNYDYQGFAEYWRDSLADYASHGIVPTWVSIQNEPDWTASYDSCRFNPTEAPWNGENFASYALALEAVHAELQASMPSPPKLLGPGCVGLYGNTGAYRDYIDAMDPDHYYGTAHHLYGGSTDGTPDGYNPAFETLADYVPEKPRFMTEFGDIKGLVECANLIHNLLVVEGVSGYNHWSLIWPGEIGLVEIENPFDQGSWTTEDGYWLNPAYWSVKHFSQHIRPGYRRVSSDSSDPDVLSSAYLSPDGRRLVAVFINRSETSSSAVSVETAGFEAAFSSIHQSTETDHFVPMGEMSGDLLTLPVASLTTVVLDQQARPGLHLKFDDGSGTTAADSTGSGWDATLVDGAAWGAGYDGGAVELDGTDAHVELPDGVVAGLDECTLSAWVELDEVPNWSRVFDFGSGTSNYMFLTPRNSVTGTARFAITTGSGEQVIDGTGPLPAGEWTHVAVTLSDSTGTLYVNGVQAGSADILLKPSDLGNTTQNWIGRSQYAADARLDGRVDDFRIYPVALGAEAVDQLYLQGPLGAPSALAATPVSASRIDLGWADAPGAESYSVHRSVSAGGPYSEIATGLGSPGFSDTAGLTPGTRYWYVVRAANPFEQSDVSNEASAVPSDPISPDELELDVSIADGDGFRMVVPNTVLGHDYRVLGKQRLSDPEWEIVEGGGPVVGTGGAIEFIFPIPDYPSYFYRLQVSRR